MIFLITFIVFCIVMLAMALKVILGESAELKRGCGNECACLHANSGGNNEPEKTFKGRIKL